MMHDETGSPFRRLGSADNMRISAFRNRDCVTPHRGVLIVACGHRTASPGANMGSIIPLPHLALTPYAMTSVTLMILIIGFEPALKFAQVSPFFLSFILFLSFFSFSLCFFVDGFLALPRRGTLFTTINAGRLSIPCIALSVGNSRLCTSPI